MFPTIVKAKIYGTQSYPLGAKEISEALAAVPQSGALKIAFYNGWKTVWAAGNWLLLKEFREARDRYSVTAAIYGYFRNQSETDGSAPGAWQIAVGPVPRAKRHAINGVLKSEGLPAIREWLENRADLSSAHGTQMLLLTYNEERESLEIGHFQTEGETFQST